MFSLYTKYLLLNNFISIQKPRKVSLAQHCSSYKAEASSIIGGGGGGLIFIYSCSAQLIEIDCFYGV